MKHFLIVLFSICLSSAFAQGSLEKNKAQIDAGLGVSGWGIPIYAGADYAIHEAITIGGNLSYRKNSESYFGSKYSQSLTVISVNGNYHFNELLKLPSPWDLYAGLSLGYYVWSKAKWKDGNGTSYYGGESSGVGINVQIGGRYFFTDKFGVNVELGGGTGSAANLGVTFKL